jgi:hypothetical protein
VFTIISDMNNPVAILQLTQDIKQLRAEYESIMDPGPNPWCHETDSSCQKNWVKKVQEREQFLTLKYGGNVTGRGETVYSPLTFVHWLIQEKKAINYPFKQYTMCEFD